METRNWNRTITIDLGGARQGVVRIENTRQAAYCLLGRWPIKRGDSYHRAILACTRALRGELPDEDASFLFADAAEDAHLAFQVSLAPSSSDWLEAEIAAICSEMAFEEMRAQ